MKRPSKTKRSTFADRFDHCAFSFVLAFIPVFCLVLLQIGNNIDILGEDPSLKTLLGSAALASTVFLICVLAALETARHHYLAYARRRDEEPLRRYRERYGLPPSE